MIRIRKGKNKISGSLEKNTRISVLTTCAFDTLNRPQFANSICIHTIASIAYILLLRKEFSKYYLPLSILICCYFLCYAYFEIETSRDKHNLTKQTGLTHWR